jgi:hypothetical protein
MRFTCARLEAQLCSALAPAANTIPIPVLASGRSLFPPIRRLPGYAVDRCRGSAADRRTWSSTCTRSAPRRARSAGRPDTWRAGSARPASQRTLRHDAGGQRTQPPLRARRVQAAPGPPPSKRPGKTKSGCALGKKRGLISAGKNGQWSRRRTSVRCLSSAVSRRSRGSTSVESLAGSRGPSCSGRRARANSRFRIPEPHLCHTSIVQGNRAPPPRGSDAIMTSRHCSGCRNASDHKRGNQVNARTVLWTLGITTAIEAAGNRLSVDFARVYHVTSTR